MKCQRCEKTATFHITELIDHKPEELHLCEDCAREYLTEPGESSANSLAGAIAQQFAVGQTAEELAKLDQTSCPMCGITFLEFRKQGRLGCAHDYVCFEKELEPLILNIHGELEHHGLHPPTAAGTDAQTNLIRLRRDMKEAIRVEDYERASHLRDEIRRLEQAPEAEQQP